MRKRLDNVKSLRCSRVFSSRLLFSFFFPVFHVTPSLCSCLLLSRVLPSPTVYRSDEDHTYVVMARDVRGMILGRRSRLVKFAVQLLRRRCQINHGKALLSRSNRQRGQTRGREDRANSAATCPRSLRRSWKRYLA